MKLRRRPYLKRHIHRYTGREYDENVDDPVTFQPVRPPGRSRVWQDGGRLWNHGGRTDREEWLFRVVDETSGDDHRGPPRMAYRRRPLPVAMP